MTRPLIYLTALACVLTALTALTIRYEMFEPGVTALFTDANGNPKGLLFNDLIFAHRMLCATAVMFLGALMTSLARAGGAILATPMMVLGTAAGLATLVMVVLSLFPLPIAPTPNEVGWILYPPLALPQTLLERLLTAIGLNPDLMLLIGPYIFLAALFGLFSGAFMMLATLPMTRWIGVIGMAFTATALLPSFDRLGEMTNIEPIKAIYPLAAVFVIIATAFLVKHPRPWLIVLTLGTAIALGFHAVMLSRIDFYYIHGTTVQLGLNYIFPLGLAWFALPAAILMYGDKEPPLALAIATPFVITSALGAWIAPMIAVGRMGQPHSYIDYPDAFADHNYTISIAVLAFVIAYPALLVTLRRASR